MWWDNSAKQYPIYPVMSCSWYVGVLQIVCYRTPRRRKIKLDAQGTDCVLCVEEQNS
jgi:hypothetical protein